MNITTKSPQKKPNFAKIILSSLAIVPLVFLLVNSINIAINGTSWCTGYGWVTQPDGKTISECHGGVIITKYGIEAIVHNLPSLIGFIIPFYVLLGIAAFVHSTISNRNTVNTKLSASPNTTPATSATHIPSTKNIISYAITAGITVGGIIAITIVLITIGTLGLGWIFAIPFIPVICTLCLRPANLPKASDQGKLFCRLRNIGVVIGLIIGAAICILTSFIGTEVSTSMFKIRSGWFPGMIISLILMIVANLIARQIYKRSSN